ncbi:MAG TPA: hypothetical protein VGI54_01805 [Solirubrobacteraceae bacterium]
MSAPLAAVAAAIREEGELTVREPAPDARAELGELAAAGPRTRDRAADYAFLVEAIREGYLLHYGTPRVVVDADPDLALLAGDRLYALGLARLAELGDTEAVEELADVISLAAAAQAEGNPALAEAAWRAGATAVARGPSPAHAAAKAAARAGEPGATERLEAVARQEP